MMIRILVILCLILTGPIMAKESLPPALDGVGIQEKIGQQLPLNATLIDSSGRRVLLKDYFLKDKPVILNFVYYHCPMLCSLHLDGFRNGLHALNMDIGDKFQVLTISMDPEDTVQRAHSYRTKYLATLPETMDKSGWEFLIADSKTIATLTAATGFSYKRVMKSDDFAHSAALIFLTSDGKISRYLYGIEFSKFNLRLAILEATNKRFVSTIEQGLLFCYNYDPLSRSFVIQSVNLMKGAAALTVLILVIIFLLLKKQENKIRRKTKKS